MFANDEKNFLLSDYSLKGFSWALVFIMIRCSLTGLFTLYNLNLLLITILLLFLNDILWSIYNLIFNQSTLNERNINLMVYERYF